MILPHELDFTQTIVEDKIFERAMILYDIGMGENRTKIENFPPPKKNLFKSYSTPENLKTCFIS